MANDSYRALIAVERKSRNLTSDNLLNDNDNIREKKVSITEKKNTSVICGDIDTPSIGEKTNTKKKNTKLDHKRVFASFLL